MTRPAPEELPLPPFFDDEDEPVEDAEAPKPVYTAVPELSDPVAVAVPDVLAVALTRVGFDAPHCLDRHCEAHALLLKPQFVTHWLLASVQM